MNSGTSGEPNLCTNAGAPTNICGVGGVGSGSGEFNQIESIAVGPSGTVYVADVKNIGPCGQFSQFSNRVQKFDTGGHAVGQISPNVPLCTRATGLAVDSAGAFYLTLDNEISAIDKFDTSGNVVNTIGVGQRFI